jgi:hypothetical protein
VQYIIKDIGKHYHKINYIHVKYHKRQRTAIPTDDTIVPKTLKTDDVILKNLGDEFALSLTLDKLVCCIEDELAVLDSHSRSAKIAAIEATKIHAEQSTSTKGNKKTGNKNYNSNKPDKITKTQKEAIISYVQTEKDDIKKTLQTIADKVQSDTELQSLTRNH